MTLTLTTTTARTFVRAPEYVVTVTGCKPVAVVSAECVVCGWAGYETCHRNTVEQHLAHLTSLHTCPEPGIFRTVS